VLRTLLIITIILLGAGLVLLLTLTVRRVLLGVRERRYAEAERRVRPIAIALVEGETTEPPALPTADDAVLADVLGRYSRRLTGEADARIAAHFRDSDALRRALGGLRSRRTWRRAEAAYRLGDMACDEVAPSLLAALDDSKRQVRGAAARSLGRLGMTTAALPLVQALVAKRLPNGVAGEALMALGPGAVPELRRIADDAEPEIRAAAVRLIGLAGGSGEAAVVERALQDPSAEVRAAAAEALGRLGAATAEPHLRSTLDDRVHFVRAEAATALGVIGSPSALPRLLEIARSDRFRPARAAAQAVARIDPEALTAAAAKADAGPHLHEAADLLTL
jgi:HEAT repeat protein